MKNLKVIAVSIAVLLIAAFTGCKSLQLVEIDNSLTKGPERVRQGYDITPSQVSVTGLFEDNKWKIVTGITQSNIVFDKNAPGRQTVRVRVGGIGRVQEATFETEVMALRTLNVTSQPGKRLFKESEDADPSWPGLIVRGEWDEMGGDDIPLSLVEITGYRKDQPGEQTIVVTYLGLQTTFSVDVRSMSGIEIVDRPTKLDYLQGELLDLAGIRVKGTWGDGIPEEFLQITANDVAGYNPNYVGIQRLTVTKNGRSEDFSVEVLGLTSITVDKPPTKTDYYYGEQLDLTGMLVYGYYTGSDPTKSRQVVIPNEAFEILGFDPERVGRQQRVELRYRGIMTNFFVNQLMPPQNVEPQ